MTTNHLYLVVWLPLDTLSLFLKLEDSLNHPVLRDEMLDEIHALDENNTWDLVGLPEGKKAVRWKWFFTVKILRALLLDLRPNLWLKAMPRLIMYIILTLSPWYLSSPMFTCLFPWLLLRIGP